MTVDVITPVKKDLLVKNRNRFIVITGPPGSGKSLLALKVASLIDPNFSIKNVVFTFEEFIKLITSNKIGKGSVVVWDEAGVNISSRDWYSQQNKAINQIMQTYRHENVCVIFTVPVFTFMDSNVRKLMHTWVKIIGVDRKNKITKCKWFALRFDEKEDKLYTTLPIFNDGLKDHKVKKISFKLADAKLLAQFEKAQTNYKLNLKHHIDVEMERRQEQEAKKNISVKEMVRKILEDPRPFMHTFKSGRQSLSLQKIEAIFGVGGRIANRARSEARDRLDGKTHTPLVGVSNMVYGQSASKKDELPSTTTG